MDPLIKWLLIVFGVAVLLTLAVLRYRLAEGGKLPEKLADAALRFIDKLPDDPFTGKAMSYHILPGGGFVVYSVGEDLTDDGGVREDAAGKQFTAGTDTVLEVRR